MIPIRRLSNLYYLPHFLLLVLFYSNQVTVAAAETTNCPSLAFCTFCISPLRKIPIRRRITTMGVQTLQEGHVSATANNNNLDAAGQLAEAAKTMTQRAQSMEPFQEEELEHVMTSLSTARSSTLAEDDSTTRFQSIRSLFADVGHYSHKNWTRTGDFASKLHPLLLPPPPGSEKNHKDEDLHPEFQDMFERVLTDGNWDAASKASASSMNSDSTTHTPWVVLVTGVNGIRKTTSVYQPWFAQVLQEALMYPTSSSSTTSDATTVSPETVLQLPTGSNSFFRQLDHMIATLVHSYFQLLYRLTSKTLDFTTTTTDDGSIEQQQQQQPPKQVISLYSQFKAALFTRFRTVSEMLGIVFIREAIQRKMNIMIETSGRDIAMFHYVDTFFPSTTTTTTTYRKLAIHFTISDLELAETSVDKRMIQEMNDGTRVLQRLEQEEPNGATTTTVKDIIRVNAGGPYGSEVLKAVQADSDRVWEEIISPSATVGKDWYKATIRIDAHATEPWTARAVRQDGSMGKVFTFEPKTPSKI